MLYGVSLVCIIAFLKLRKTNPTFAYMILFFLLVKYYKFVIRKKKSLRNKVVLITGGASGIGKLTALNLKKLGAVVVIWDINAQGLKEMQGQVDATMLCDITQRDTVMGCAQKILNKYQAVDILINNAGIVAGKRITQLTETQIRKTFEVNVISHFWTLQAFLPAMTNQRSGHIVTIASTAAYTGVPCLTDYCSSKFAARGLHDSLSRELMDQKLDCINTTCIYPYVVDTGMFQGMVCSRSWLLRKLAGLELLEPQYVADEIVRAIQYNIRDLILPPKLANVLYMEHMIPQGVQDWLLSYGPSMAHFTGRTGQPQAQVRKKGRILSTP